MVQIVNHFGVHKDEMGVVYLLQGDLSGDFIDLGTRAPFEVNQRNCPHLIPLSDPVIDKKHWTTFKALMKDSLIEQMLPLPKRWGQPTLIFSDEYQELTLKLITLSRMCSPVRQVILPMTIFSHKEALKELATTNIAPLVLTGVNSDHQRIIEKLVHESLLLPRRLVLLGAPTVVAAGLIKRDRTDISLMGDEDLMALPMEAFGSKVIRQYARGERIGGDSRRSTHV